MRDLFANLYSRVVNFFKSTEEIGEQTKEVARNRLKLVLMQDRTNLTPAVLERMRGELINLLSKYVELDQELLDLNFEQEGDQMALMLSIPVVRAKTEEEIQKAIQEDEAIKDVALADDEDDDEEGVDKEDSPEEDEKGETFDEENTEEETSEEDSETEESSDEESEVEENSEQTEVKEETEDKPEEKTAKKSKNSKEKEEKAEEASEETSEEKE